VEVKGFEKKEKSTAEMTVLVSPEEFEAAVNKAYLKERGRIAVPGFRKGKAPRKMIENLYGTGVFYEEAIDALCPTALRFGADEQKIRVVGQAGVKDFSVGDDKSLTIEFVVALYPEIAIKGYKGIKAEKPAVHVVKKDVDAELERIRERNARIQAVEREAKEGDIVNIDFEGFTDGKAFDGGKGEKHDLTLGSKTFIPGFEEKLIGVKAGDSVDVDVTFPKDYAPELAGKDAIFKVKVNEVKEKLLPDLDDEFAKDVSEFDTLKEYTADVKKKLVEEREHAAGHEFEDNVMDKLVELVEGDIPDAMVDEQVEETIADYDRNLSSRGMSFQQYMSMMGMDVAGFKQTMRPSAERQLKAQLAFEKIAELEKIEITDERLEEEYAKMAEQYKIKVEDIKAAVDVERLKNELRYDAAHKLVMDSAVAESKAAKEPKEEAAEKPAKKTAPKAKKEAPADEKAEKPAKTAKKAAPKADAEKKPAKKTPSKAKKDEA